MFFSFEVGDFLLHPKYGVGRFLGMEYIEVNNSGHEFAKLEYANETYIFVPMFNVSMLKLHSTKETKTEIEDLGQSKVLRLRKKIYPKLKKIAYEMAQIAAQRATVKVQAFKMPDDYAAFKASFKENGVTLELTPSQHSAINDILSDLQSTKPMDRLVCGDVGFGKTEVAMHACFVAARAKQAVLVVVPTVLLAQQHYELFSERFKEFGIKCCIASRLHGKDVLQRWLRHEFDILITTASNRTGINNLLHENIGLIILDEEHHFGAKFKEEIRSNNNTLYLSASPIPRTLNVALAGLKDISVLDIPPVFKQNTIMNVAYHEDFDLNAILRTHDDLVFIVTPRISDIQEIEKKLAPEFQDQYVIMHGRLDQKELQQNIESFKSEKKRIMISTNIIESGINIPHANLMIIFDSHMFGTAQLYQLRGRIGRGAAVGTIYLIIPKILQDVAAERLEMIKSHNFLGANFSLAVNDLKLRGSGMVLGHKQSGSDHGFGLESYYELFTRALNEERNIQTKQEINFDVVFDGFKPALIPHDFIESETTRLNFYRKLSQCVDEAALQQVKNELVCFGPVHNALLNLLELIQARIFAMENVVNGIDIKKIVKRDGKITITYHEHNTSKILVMQSGVDVVC